jgi:hypothetical protein
MTLNIYVGALTYFWEWEWLPAEGPPKPEPSLPITVLMTRETHQTEIQLRRDEIVAWRARLSKELGSKIPAPLDWDETETEYGVATPHHDGMRAVRLWAAYADHPDLQLPLRDMELKDDRAYLRSMKPEADTRYLQIIGNTDYWLPSSFDFTFKVEGPDGEPADVGSTPTLLKQLQDLNEATWKATQKTIEEWEEIGLPSDGSLEEKARYGFSQLFLIAQYACNKGMPMKING